MAETGSVRVAARAADVDRSTPYLRAQRDAAFAEAWAQARDAWAAAREFMVDLVEGEAFQRALEGDPRMIEAVLRAWRPERYGPKLDVRLDVRREAERIAAKTGRTVEEVLEAVQRRAREMVGR
jgi:hypothetical protein